VPDTDSDSIAANLAAVRARLERAARAAGRDPATVRLIAISKTFSADAVRAAYHAGHRDFGENKVQEALQKMEQTSDLTIDWHLVGHLQSNKAKRVAGFAAIHAIDSLDLLLRVDRAAAEQGASPRLLIQVDLAGETTKFGIAESDVAGLIGTELHAARLVGLMLLPPYAENPEDVRPWFRRARELAEQLRGMGFPPDRLAELSMGMSHDFEVAIQEGATMVRVGTAIFGERQVPGGTEKSR